MSPKDAHGIANSEDPDQTAPLGAVWSGSALFAQTYLSENLGSLRYAICSNFYTPANCVCGRVYGFHVVRPSVWKSGRVSVTFCFLNILKNHWWNFIKFCKHIHMYKANTTDETLRSYRWNFIKTCEHIPIFKTNTYNKNWEPGANVMRVISLCNS